MKITKSLRIFLVLLSVMMVLPLFACGETPEETTTKAPEATTAPGEKETTAEKTDDTTEPKAPATTVADDDDDDTTEAPATTVADDTAETTAEETTETETETATESDGESDTTETTAEETTTACAHASVTYNDNCDAICSSCGEILATEVHPDHAETYVDENGVRTYTVKCAVCDKPLYEYTMQLGEIAPELIITADKLSLMVKVFSSWAFRSAARIMPSFLPWAIRACRAAWTSSTLFFEGFFGVLIESLLFLSFSICKSFEFSHAVKLYRVFYGMTRVFS